MALSPPVSPNDAIIVLSGHGAQASPAFDFRRRDNRAYLWYYSFDLRSVKNGSMRDLEKGLLENGKTDKTTAEQKTSKIGGTLVADYVLFPPAGIQIYSPAGAPWKVLRRTWPGVKGRVAVNIAANHPAKRFQITVDGRPNDGILLSTVFAQCIADVEIANGSDADFIWAACRTE